MKAGSFNNLIADAFTMPKKTVTVYTRLLKEAQLLTSGKGGRAAPEMSPLDAARITIAVLTTESPSQCVERVKRFGEIEYSPNFRRKVRGYETIKPEQFSKLFEGLTLEEVLAHIFALPSKLGIDGACAWHSENIFHLRISDFEVLAELFQWSMDDGEVVGELVAPFKGKTMVPTSQGFKHVEEYSPIKGGIRTQRSIIGSQFLSIGLALALDDNGNPLRAEKSDEAKK